jgi:hypothetical protein
VPAASDAIRRPERALARVGRADDGVNAVPGGQQPGDVLALLLGRLEPGGDREHGRAGVSCSVVSRAVLSLPMSRASARCRQLARILVARGAPDAVGGGGDPHPALQRGVLASGGVHQGAAPRAVPPSVPASQENKG